MKGIQYDYAVFDKSNIYGIYDITNTNCNFSIHYLKFEKPKERYLIDNGVSDVVMSWDKSKNKILHSGLIPIGGGCLFGNNLKPNGKKDFILMYFDNVKVQIHFFLIKNRSPKRKTEFATNLKRYFISLGYPF